MIIRSNNKNKSFLTERISSIDSKLQKDIDNLDNTFVYKPYIIDRIKLGFSPSIYMNNNGKLVLEGDYIVLGNRPQTEDRIINLVTSLAIASNKTFISFNTNETIKFWNINNGECINTFKENLQNIESLEVTPDKKTLILGKSNGSIHFLDIFSCNYIKILEGHTADVNAMAITSDCKTIISGSSDRSIKIWDIQSGMCLNTLEGHTDRINAVTITSDGKTIISASSDSSIKIWDIQSGECIRTIKSSVSSITITPDGKTVITGGEIYNENIELFNITNGECLNTLEGHTDRINAVTITSDGKTIISASSDSSIKIWDIQSGECLNTLKGHTGSVYSLVVTNDGKTIISGSLDETIKLWDIQSGECIQTIYNMENGSSITMLKDNYFNASEVNIDKFMRIDDVTTQCRKLTKEEIVHFCKVKYANHSLDNNNISNIQSNDKGSLLSQKSKLQIIKDNIGSFFILWVIIIFLNQFLLFNGCFNYLCILAALPHTGIITLLLLPFLLKDEKTPPREYSYKAPESHDLNQFQKHNKVDPLKEMGDDYEKKIGRAFESKGDFVIYNGLIKGFADGGVDLIVISPDNQSINFIQCKNWQNKKMDYNHICDVYDKLNKFSSNINITGMLGMFFVKYLNEIQHHLYFKKNRDEIAHIFKSAYNYSIKRKTLYVSTEQIIETDVNQNLTRIKSNIFRYQDMKIVISNI